MTPTLTNMRRNEQGNALFLILIAVILFAALSYAITQSNRSGGNTARETNLISSTTVTQYPSAVRTGVTRMLLRGRIPSELLFHAPGSFTGGSEHLEVFHPSGGGVSFQNVDPNTVDVNASGVPQGQWYFLKNKVVTDVGTTTGEVVAVLTRVKTGVCQQINEQITGSSAIPASGLTEAQAIADGANDFTGTDITGRPFQCVSVTTPASNVYYHVVSEQ